MASGRLETVISKNEERIKKACSLAMKAHKSPGKQYLVEKNRGSSDVIFSFPGCWSVNDWFSQHPFGEKKIDLAQFPALRSIGDEKIAAVNETFLKRFQAILPHLQNEVERAATAGKQIVFTGHSSAGAIAILMTVWFLEKYRKQDTSRMPPLCITFGSPIVGDRIFNHALRRESWSQYFIHFVMRYDIIPRVLLAPLSSLEQQLQIILNFLSQRHAIPEQELTEEALTLYLTVMRKASSVASHNACYIMGNSNKLSETLLSFIELSPYRPFGTYVFCTGNGELVVVKNPDAVLQILFYSSQLISKTEGRQIALRSVKDHHNYQSELQSLETKGVALLDNLEGLPLSSAAAAAGNVTTGKALKSLGLSTRARLCLCAAGELEKKKLRNQDDINKKRTNIEGGLRMLEGYKTRCEARGVSYYDAFKLSKDTDDFNANVKRLELAGIFDEIMDMLKRFELPEEFEGHRDWIDIGTRYRRIAEPLDIANYYRHVKYGDTGPYLKVGRPTRYKFTQKWLEYALKISSWESCFWAEIEELCLRTSSMGLSEDDKEKILSLENQVEVWIQNRQLGDDIFFEDSTFVKWWKTLPQQHRSGSCISKRINN